MEKTLKPASFQSNKSFYGKAHIRIEDGETILKSYKTDVCKIDSKGNFHKLWNGYSKTTLSHVVAFCDEYGIECGGNKKWWIELPCDNGKSVQYKVVNANGFREYTYQVVFDDYADAQNFADSITSYGGFWHAFVEEI